MKNLKELLNDISQRQYSEGDYCRLFCEYSEGTLINIINDIADKILAGLDTDAAAYNNANLMEIEDLEKKVLEDVKQKQYKFYLAQSIREGVYKHIKDLYANALEDTILYYVCLYLLRKTNTENFEDDVLDNIISEINLTDVNQNLEDINKIIDRHIDTNNMALNSDN